VSILDRNEFYEMIFKEHLNIIKTIVKSTIYSQNLADIEDCVQNVLVAALQKQDLQEHPNVEGWLYITGKNMALQFNREHLKREKLPDVDNFELAVESFEDRLIEDLEFERLKEQDCMKKLLTALSKTEKHFFYLRYVKKYDNRKISAITGKTEASIRVRYSRLGEKIKKEIKKIKNM
jgi:RNA polymerase sigma-70 factor (ECF subfamily)